MPYHMRFNVKQNPYFLFSPFLVYYVYRVLKFKYPVLYGDEPRYVGFASNLIHGFYSPPAPDINLWSGPGYPIVLMPCAALHLPVIWYPLLNALFFYLSVVFFYQALRYMVKEKLAMLFAVIWAFYINLYQFLPAIYTEVFTSFLIVSIVYSVTLYFVKHKTIYLVLSGFLIGFLALTKIIFGYVILLCLIICLLLSIIKAIRISCINAVYIFAIALLTTVPYLSYTQHLTGKIFYWGNSGGMSLYWMSSPYDLEYGDWKAPYLSNSILPMPFKSTEGDSLLQANHAKEISFIMAHQGVEQDELFKKAAIRNIKSAPKKFVKNYFYNISRMLFDFPYSYTYQVTQTISNIITGSLLLWASVICLVISVINRKQIIYPVKLTMLLFTVYFLLSGFASAYVRQLDVVVPILLFWIACTIDKLPKMSLKFKETAV
ncbi:ArnT family glycosyltransferase [Mucilaginibacter sp. R-33]|uniref:ArnT family glycosyltransferase n=1 Tax=Mucilaginibacter sp. R-33 TaxID=3416711 RepID=UPI003CEA6F92